MPSVLTQLGRFCLLKLRRHPSAFPRGIDPYSPEYLYLVQQSKRVSLSATMARLRPRNIIILPILLLIIGAKVVDLWMATLIIRGLINERDLLEMSGKSEVPRP